MRLAGLPFKEATGHHETVYSAEKNLADCVFQVLQFTLRLGERDKVMLLERCGHDKAYRAKILASKVRASSLTENPIELASFLEIPISSLLVNHGETVSEHFCTGHPDGQLTVCCEFEGTKVVNQADTKRLEALYRLGLVPQCHGLVALNLNKKRWITLGYSHKVIRDGKRYLACCYHAGFEVNLDRLEQLAWAAKTPECHRKAAQRLLKGDQFDELLF